IASQRVIKRFDSKPVTREHQPVASAVPDRKRKHPAKMLDAFRPMFFIKVNDCFRVAVGAISVAGCLQLLAQVAMVVDLAVVDYPTGLIFIGHRLMTAAKIDNREPAVSEPDVLPNVLFDQQSSIVRSAVFEGIPHSCERLLLDSLARLSWNGNAANPAHQSS